MTRVEIIANQALEEQLIEIMPVREGGHPCYTMIHQVDGSGYSGWCMGNDVWPEENILFILYLNDIKLEKLKADINELRERFPILGLACFELPGVVVF
ncbi:MAG: hypothetical protein PQJ59_06120 [Spirochaetales bacterium]|nr:hypothetical protein [Spirochaetales bacterium]